MGIGSVTSTNSISSMQMIKASSTDPKIKTIEDELSDVQQQIQKLSSKQELTATEKTDERKKLQQEKSSLSTELKQHQEQLRKSQKRESMMAELLEDKGPTKEEKSEDKIQSKEISSDKADEKNLPTDKQQARQQGTVITQNSDGTVILKDGMSQDENRGVDTEKEQDDEAKEEIVSVKGSKSKDDDTAIDIGLSFKETHAIVSADSSTQQASLQGTIISSTRDGIAILKGEMNLDEQRGVNTERKQDALEKMEEKEQRATTFQFSVLGKAMKSAAGTNVAGITNRTQVNAENNAFINALRLSQEDQAAQQRFQVSFG